MPVLKESMKLKMKDLLQVLVDDGTIGDQLTDLLDLDDPLLGCELQGEARDKFMLAVGFFQGVAEDRDCTIIELFDIEDL